jgi:phosphoribosylaminoimidazolecarboxamide formyltransferase/IMP cyclohydrolase
MTQRLAFSRALISVSDKTGVVELAERLVAAGVELVSTGSTAKLLRESGLPVVAVEAVTGFPESLDGRVKTLHPSIHGGILADLRLESHRNQLNELGIAPFNLVIVNLYPFRETVAAGASNTEIIEQIDIGGPALIRAAAKNHANVGVITSATQYPELFEELAAGGATAETLTRWASAAFSLTATYDAAIASWFQESLVPDSDSRFPETYLQSFSRIADLRYGENAHQRAALYQSQQHPVGIAAAEQLSGKEMSFNNYLDAEAALRCVLEFKDPAVAIMKHNNPCGIATADSAETRSLAEVYRAAHSTDPISAFGGVIALNREVDLQTATAIGDVFTEVVVAPGFSPEALAALREKKNLRLLRLPAGLKLPQLEARSISGGLLLQERDVPQVAPENWNLVAGAPATPQQLADLYFAWLACKSVKSNAILLASNLAAVGIGMGQVNRLDSCRLAVARAGSRAGGSVAASDAFFPFADGLEILIAGGVTAVVQPGGSIRDAEVIELAKAANLTMYFTGERHFLH